MRRLRTSLLAAATAVATLAAIAPAASAGAAVCTDPIPRELCGGRVFPEPMTAVSGLTYRQMVMGMEQLASDHPDWITFSEFGDGSADGNALYVAEVTSPHSTIPLEDRKIVLVNQSIHGNEPGGREGAVRYVEDLVTDRAPGQAALLDRVRLVQTFINPDGWAAGDHDHVQTGGGAGLWARQNGDGFITGAADFGLGIDLNRQAPWRGISHTVTPLSAPESIAFEAFVSTLADEGDIQASVDIHGEVTDAAAWVMLSAGQFDLDDMMNQLYQGDKLDADLRAALESSTAKSLMEDLQRRDIPATVLTASSEFGSISSESISSGTGFQGDWIAQPEGGDSASLSTIELYNFTGSPGLNSLTARREVMQLYRDVVGGILGSLIESAALEHDTTMHIGTVAYVDDAPRVSDPVREGVVVSSADFFTDLAPQVDGELRAIDAADVASGAADAADSIVVTTDGLLSSPAAVAQLRSYVEGGGNVVLTDAALKLLPSLVNGIADSDLSRQMDVGGKVSYTRTHPMAEGIRDIGWMNIEAATMGLRVSSGGNVPAWRVNRSKWEAAGGTTAGISGSGQTSVGEIAVGDGTVRTIGVLLPTPDNTGNIIYGINGYGVLDTGYIVLANALDAELELVTTSSVPAAEALGTVVTAGVGDAPAPSGPSQLPAALVLLVGLALTIRTARPVKVRATRD